MNYYLIVHKPNDLKNKKQININNKSTHETEEMIKKHESLGSLAYIKIKK